MFWPGGDSEYCLLTNYSLRCGGAPSAVSNLQVKYENIAKIKNILFLANIICIYVGQEWGYNRLNRFLCFVVCRSVCPQCSLHCSQCALQGDVAGPWTNLFAQCKIKTKKSECPRLPGSRGSSVNKLASNLPVMSQYQSFQRDFAIFTVFREGPYYGLSLCGSASQHLSFTNTWTNCGLLANSQ